MNTRMKDTGLEQLREELREVHDQTTNKLIKKAQHNDRTNSISFDDFKKKYNTIDFLPVTDTKRIKTLQKVSGKKDDTLILG